VTVRFVYPRQCGGRALAGLGRQFSSKRGKLDLFSAGAMLVLQFSGHGGGDFVIPINAAFDVILGRAEKVEMFSSLALGRLITVHADMAGFSDALDAVARKTRTVGMAGTLLSAS
jgi:hypothetical protein